MRVHPQIRNVVLAAMAVACSAGLRAQSDGTAAIQQQLTAQYRLTTVTPDRTSISTAGDVVQIHKPGLLMYSVASPLPASNNYRNGKIGQGAGGFGQDFKIGVLAGQRGESSNYPRRTMPAEEKCWVTSIQVQKDGVLFQLLSDPFDNSRYYANLKIPFPIRGSVPPVSVALANVAEVLTVATPPAAPAPAPEPIAPPAPPPAPMPDIAPPPPPTDAPTISVGQTKEQVIAALGKPDKTTKVGAREICFFKTTKVTFVNGKVTKVE